MYNYLTIILLFFIDNYIQIMISLLFLLLFSIFLSSVFLYKSNNSVKNLWYFKIWLLFILIMIYFMYIYTVFLVIFMSYFKFPYYIYFSYSYFYFKSILFIDGFSVLFILLLTFLIPVCLILNVFYNYKLFVVEISNYSLYSKFFFGFKKTNFTIFKNNLLFIIMLFFLYLNLFLIFIVSDILSFYLLFEFSVIPLYFMIGSFGSRLRRIKAAYYVLFFTIFSSFPFLIAIMMLSVNYGSLNLFYLICVDIPFSLEKIIWIFFFIALAVKVPIFPLHYWLPEAHVEASTEGSVLLAGLLLKLGLYGMIRFLIPILPNASLFYSPLVYTIALAGIFYISCIIFVQLDLKKIIAYSSIVHMNFSLIGLFSGTIVGIQGSIFLMFTHGFVSSGLFILIGFLYSRHNTRLIYYYQGLIHTYPTFSTFFFLFIVSNFGLPGTSGFIGEFLIILGILSKNILVGCLSMGSPLFSAIYSLLLYSRIFHGTPSSAINYNDYYNKTLYNNVDLNNNIIFFKPSMLSIEYYLLLSFSFYNIFLGIFPKIYLKLISNISYCLYIGYRDGMVPLDSRICIHFFY